VSESIWKKEISFRRKGKDEQATSESAAPAPARSNEQVPWWKKEVALSRKAKPEKAREEQKPSRERAVGTDGDVPFWKKEISLSRKPKAAPAHAAEPEAVAPPEADVAVPDAVADVAERIAPWVAAAADAAARAQAGEATPAADAPTVEIPAAAAPAQDVQLPPAPAAPPAAAPEPAPAPVPAPVQPAAPTPPAPDVTPRAVVTPPVPASELPPLPDEEERKPFWKRDLGRKKGPKAEEEPKAKPERKRARTPKPKRERVSKQRDGKVPKRLVGLKVGASQLAAARVANNGSAELVQVAREALDPGVVVGGELRDPEALSVALKEFFRRHKLPRTGVRLGIANNRIGVRTFEIVGIDDPKQLANAIKFRAQEALPIPIEEAVLDYHVLSEQRNDDGQTVRRVLLVVAYRELVDRYVDACRKAGLRLAAIDLEAFALLRALAAPQDGAGGDVNAAFVAVSIGHDRSTFAVSDGRICEFTRVLEWGGSALNVALARELNAAPSEVEEIKRSLSLLDAYVPPGLTAEQTAAAREAVRKQVQAFARELVSSLQFYQSQAGSLGIGEIVLTGGTAHLHGLAEELQRLIGVHVRIGDPFARVKLPKKFDDPEQVGSLAIAVGLGIDD
jgi:type IV pilus assembly protein PilM